MSKESEYRKLQKKHLARVEKYVRELQKLYSKASDKFALIAADADYDGGGQFYFSDYPELAKEVERTARELATGIQHTILSGTSAEWARGNTDAGGIVEYALHSAGIASTTALSAEAIGKYFNNHASALAAFQKRTIGGLSLSSKVWDLAQHEKIEVELARSIAKGTSAAEVAANIKEFLNEPDKLFRRVRDEYGVLRLSKHARAYEPGMGTYRSSYRNALRLARTEINMSYRNAELESYRDKDYVVGYEIHRSTTPYDCPICAALKGKYPKTFVWSGWHPNCRCFITPILMTDKEIDTMRDAIINGDDFSIKSENEVSSLPSSFNEWIKQNEDRIANARDRGTLPYFFRDNEQMMARSVLDPKGRMQTGYVEFYAGRKYLKNSDGSFTIYGTRTECERQIAQWEEIQAKIKDITPKFQRQCEKVLAETPDAKFSGIVFKQRGSAIRKADTKFNGDLSQIEDLVRCNFSSNMEDYEKVCNSIRSKLNLYKDMSTAEYMHLQKEDNYICRFMNVLFENGQTGEIMVTPFEMVCAREADAKTAQFFIGETNYARIAADAKKSGIELHKGHLLYEKQKIATTKKAKKAIYAEMEEYYLKVRRLCEAEEMTRKSLAVGNDLESLALSIAKASKADVTPINYKSVDSIVRKTLGDGCTAYTLQDCVRTTIVADKSKLDSIANMLQKDGTLKCTRYKIQSGSSYYGYTGRLLNFRLPNGMVGEIQVNTPEMIFAKEKPDVAKSIIGSARWNSIRNRTGLEGGLGHEYYEKIRVLDKGTEEYEKYVRLSEAYYAHFQ